MKDYESIYILNPSLEEAEAEKLGARFQEAITSHEGEIVKVEKWGKRKLAYTVRKQKKGDYVLVQFRGVAKTVSELERNYKMTDSVIKFMTTRIEKDVLAHQVRVAEAQEAQAVEQAQAAEAEAAAETAAETAAASAPAEAPVTTEETSE